MDKHHLWDFYCETFAGTCEQILSTCKRNHTIGKRIFRNILTRTCWLSMNSGQICMLLEGYKQGSGWGIHGQRPALTAGGSPCTFQTRVWLLETQRQNETPISDCIIYFSCLGKFKETFICNAPGTWLCIRFLSKMTSGISKAWRQCTVIDKSLVA